MYYKTAAATTLVTEEGGGEEPPSACVSLSSHGCRGGGEGEGEKGEL